MAHRTMEVLLIPDSDLETLQSFDGHGHITLSAYVCLDTPEHCDAAYDLFVRQMQARLDEYGPRPEWREAIKEDMEIVGLYLRTNGHRHRPGLVIFSCAAELFWRAYPLEMPVSAQVSLGPRFNLEPLLRPPAGAISPESGLSQISRSDHRD